MQRYMCKGKIHRATVTEADLNYPGSITIDKGTNESSQPLTLRNGSNYQSS